MKNRYIIISDWEYDSYALSFKLYRIFTSLKQAKIAFKETIEDELKSIEELKYYDIDCEPEKYRIYKLVEV